MNAQTIISTKKWLSLVKMWLELNWKFDFVLKLRQAFERKKKARIRAEVEALIRAEQEEALLRARIRAEVQAEVEEKLRAEIRAQLLEEKKAQPCTICFGNIDDQVTTLCGHTFCSGCLAKWRQRGHTLCPMCRSCLD
ncbi:hypothetical protein KRP22_005155 [Phytophthora ramorum]|nr:Tripartite motif-containing protein 65 [Phytophthora ramorum]